MNKKTFEIYEEQKKILRKQHTSTPDNEALREAVENADIEKIVSNAPKRIYDSEITDFAENIVDKIMPECENPLFKDIASKTVSYFLSEYYESIKHSL